MAAPNASSTGIARALAWDETLADRGDGTSDVIGWEADSGFGPWYQIEMAFASDSYVWDITYDSVPLGNADDPDTAKKMAQADFEKRAMSILTAAQRPVTRVAPGIEPWTPDGYWEYVGGLAGEWERDQMRDTLAERGLQIVGRGDLAYGAWQPIETYDPGHSGQEVTPSVLVVDRGIVSEAYYDGEDGSWWLANTSEYDFDACQAIYPTHWAPMPAGPSVSSTESK